MKYILMILFFWTVLEIIRHFFKKRCSCWNGDRKHNWCYDYIKYAGHIQSCSKCGKVRNIKKGDKNET